MSRICAGESCSLIGVASVGKSNLLRFLMQPNIRQHYLGHDWELYHFVVIDRNKLAEVSDVTRSPTRQSATPAPTSLTMPQNSWQRVTGGRALAKRP